MINIVAKNRTLYTNFSQPLHDLLVQSSRFQVQSYFEFAASFRRLLEGIS